MAPLVLLVEDNLDNRAIYRTMLEHAGYPVIEAADGRSALQLARSERPDLILMDIAIPEVDGWTVTRILKEDPATAGIPIIALTAHALQEDRLKAVEAGCDGYLAKPVAPRDVVDEVARFVGSPRGMKSGGPAPSAIDADPEAVEPLQ